MTLIYFFCPEFLGKAARDLLTIKASVTGHIIFCSNSKITAKNHKYKVYKGLLTADRCITSVSNGGEEQVNISQKSIIETQLRGFYKEN